VEIADVSLTILNNPWTTITFNGEGKSSLAGTIQVSGTWRRDSGELCMHAQAAPIAVGPPSSGVSAVIAKTWPDR
jgi:ABC-type uncharacterized transport system ATPase component